MLPLTLFEGKAVEGYRFCPTFANLPMISDQNQHQQISTAVPKDVGNDKAFTPLQCGERSRLRIIPKLRSP